MNMITVAILGLMLAVTATFGKSVSSVPGCEPELLLDCTKRLEYLNSDTALDLGASQQDLEKVCPTLQEGMKCINDYSNKCLPENIQTYFQSMYNGTILVISELCRPGDFQSEYLKHAPCMDKAKAEYKQCVDEYNSVMTRVNPLEKEQRSNNIKVMCCSFSDYIDCSNRLVYKRCGQDTAKFTQTLLDRLASPIIQEHCYRHFDGKQECAGIMSSLETGNLKNHEDEHHEHNHGPLDHDEPVPEPGTKSQQNPWNGDVAVSDPTSNDIDREALESPNAEPEPTRSSAASMSSLLMAILSPAVLMLLV